MKKLTIVLLGLMLAACSSVPVSVPGVMGPVEAVRAAAKYPDHGIRGQFAFTVRRVGSSRGKVYLDSKWNYTAHDALIIEMSVGTAKALAERVGTHIKGLMDRHIVVHGVAKRVRISVFNQDGSRVGDHYYQTQVRVTSPSQVTFAH